MYLFQFWFLWCVCPAVGLLGHSAKSLQSCPTLRPHRWQPTRLPCGWDSPGKNTGVGSHFLLQCMKVKSESEFAQSCPTLSDTMDCSPPAFSVHGIFQARVLEWGAIVFSVLGHMAVQFPVFQGISTLFSRVAVLVYIPTNSVRGFHFLHTVLSICCL